MGYNSVIFICNDAMGQISKDPVGWWEKTREVLAKCYRKGEDGVYGFGNHCNGFQVVSNEHADHVTLIAAGGNYASIIGTKYYGWNSGHHKIDGKIKLLEEMLEELKKQKNGKK